MKTIYKNIYLSFLLVICISLTGCYKSDSLDFMQGQYIMNKSETDQCSLEGAIIEDASIILFEIDKQNYDSCSKINVLENRYSNEYYSVSLKMKINGIEYNDIETHEYEGSSAYPNRYILRILLTINDKYYDCKLILDFLKYSWEHQGDENEANYIACSLSPVIEEKENEGKLQIFSQGNYGYFYLSYNTSF